MQKIVLVFALCFGITYGTAFCQSASTINKIEYFFGRDPGFGKAIDVPVIRTSVIADQVFNVDVSGLPRGLHYLQVRSQDAAGKWSVVNKRMIYREIPPNAILPKITRIEYFINNDLGIGKGTSIPFTASENVENLAVTINLGYAAGIHYLYMRAMDETGKYGVTSVKQFEILGVLPITLLDYKASLGNNKVKHAWRTANEVNVSHFTVERSLDGVSFVEVGRVSANNKKEQQQYFFNDEIQAQLNNQVLYYRLKMVDKNGEFSYSELKTIKPETLKNFVVSPNPATDFINIAGEGIRSIAIHSIAGQTVYNANLNPIWERHTISFGKLPSGLYLVKMVKTNNEVVVEKLIIK